MFIFRLMRVAMPLVAVLVVAMLVPQVEPEAQAAPSRAYLQQYQSRVVPCPPKRDHRLAFECGSGFYLDATVLEETPLASDRELALLAYSGAKGLYLRLKAIQRLFTKAGIPASQAVAAQKFPTPALLRLISELESGKVSAYQTRNHFIRLSHSYRHHVQFNQLK